MKFLKIIIPSLGILSVVLLFQSCNKETPRVAFTRGVNFTSTVQVFSATVKAARNYVYVDGVPVSGAALAFGGVFPGTAYSFNVGASLHTFLIRDTLPTTTQLPLTFTQTLEVGKDYTIFTYDTITSVKQLTVLNNIVLPNDTTCMLRFANFVYNTSPVPNVDVYSYRRGALPVFTNIPTNSVTNYVPYASGISDTLYVYATGTVSPLIVKQFVTSLTPGRSYTSAYNGSFKGTKAVTTFVNY